jgi:hypothetical protein
MGNRLLCRSYGAIRVYVAMTIKILLLRSWLSPPLNQKSKVTSRFSTVCWAVLLVHPKAGFYQISGD